MGSIADNSSSALSPAASQGENAGAAACVICDGVTFTSTEGNRVAEVVVARGGGAAHVLLPSESFLDESTGTRHHFVDVQGEADAMLFLVSVLEDNRSIVAVKRFC